MNKSEATVAQGPRRSMPLEVESRDLNAVAGRRRLQNDDTLS